MGSDPAAQSVVLTTVLMFLQAMSLFRKSMKYRLHLMDSSPHLFIPGWNSCLPKFQHSGTEQ